MSLKLSPYHWFSKTDDYLLYCFLTFLGVDYVAHEDIIPYTVTEEAKPIQHELFDKFLTPVTDVDKSKIITFMGKFT
jgi:hypothetical protein